MPLSPEIVQRNKDGAGSYIRRLRRALDISQSELAIIMGIESRNMICAIERGHVTVPPSSYRSLAEALRVDPREFTVRMMAWNDPQTYAGLFNNMDVKVAILLVTKGSPRFRNAGRPGIDAYDEAVSLVRQLIQDGGWSVETLNRGWSLLDQCL